MEAPQPGEVGAASAAPSPQGSATWRLSGANSAAEALRERCSGDCSGGSGFDGELLTLGTNSAAFALNKKLKLSLADGKSSAR